MGRSIHFFPFGDEGCELIVQKNIYTHCNAETKSPCPQTRCWQGFRPTRCETLCQQGFQRSLQFSEHFENSCLPLKPFPNKASGR